MSAPSTAQPQSLLQRHPGVRWMAPVAVLGLAGLAATGIFNATASSQTLARTSPAALVAAVQTAKTPGYSGTVVSQMSLGLPDLPDVGGDSSFTSLLSGSHTVQVWYGGPDKQRIALLGATDETDLFHDGRDVWRWSSADQVAVHSVQALRAGAAAATPPVPTPATSVLTSMASVITPDALARRALASLEPTTKVDVVNGRDVADRAAYELVLTPGAGDTKIGSVHISVDGDTKVPLAVQVFARGSASPAIDVAFTSIRFADPSDRNFEFTPPPNATVREAVAARPVLASSGAQAGLRGAQITGTGWSRVLGVSGGSPLAEVTQGPLLGALSPVSGAWGKGRLLDSALLSVLVTTDGRIYAGAVPPADLYAAAGRK